MTRSESFRISRSTISSIFVLLAAVLGFVSYMLHTAGEFHWGETRLWGAEVIKDIAVVVFSLALVDFLWRRFGGDPLDLHIEEVQAHLDQTVAAMRKSQVLLTEADSQGLVRISSGHRDLGIALLDWVSLAERTIEMCGYTLHSVFQDGVIIDKLRDKVRSGVSVRILISGANNQDIFSNIDPNNSAPMKGQISAVCHWLTQIREQLNEEQRGRFLVRSLDRGKLTISILRFDRRILASIYLRSKFIAETPTMIVEGDDKKLFKTYAKEFDFFFSQAQSIW